LRRATLGVVRIRLRKSRDSF